MYLRKINLDLTLLLLLRDFQLVLLCKDRSEIECLARPEATVQQASPGQES